MNEQAPIQPYTADGELRCRFRQDNEPCPEPAVYAVVIDECVLCPRYGLKGCGGHRACIEHGALLRGDCCEWDFGDGDPDDGRDVPVARISATYREAS